MRAMEHEFVTADPATHEALRAATDAVVDALVRTSALPGPRSPLSTEQLKAAADALDPCPPDGAPLRQVLEDLAPIFDGGIRLGDPWTVAHLHPAPLIPAAPETRQEEAQLLIGLVAILTQRQWSGRRSGRHAKNRPVVVRQQGEITFVCSRTEAGVGETAR
jgi:hypothetical protein